MKLLITGSNGMTGMKIIYACQQKPDIHLIAASLGPNLCRLTDGYIYEPIDITIEAEVDAIFDKYKPDVVINTAAFTNVDGCESNKTECRKLNVDAVAYLVKNCEKHNAHLIHFSTDFVFNGEKGPY